MCKVQEKAKNERQNDDCATTNTNPNSSSLNDNAHHIRRRLSQTITSRHCLLIAIALASLSAHACGDTVELQVTCDSAETTWVVPSSKVIDNDTTVTVGSCNDGRVEYVAQVKGNDIDDKGIVICSQNVCYHLQRQNDNLIDVKNCDGYGDPICNYICHGGSITRKGVAKPDGTDREEIDGNIICDGSTNNAYTYECNGNNIVTQTPCQYGCADDHKGCKPNPDLTDKCKANDTPICEGKTIKICENNKWESTVKRSICQKVNGSSIMYKCQDSGEASPIEITCPLGCDKNGDKCKPHICESGKRYECEEGVLFECGNGTNSDGIGTYIEGGKACNEMG